MGQTSNNDLVVCQPFSSPSLQYSVRALRGGIRIYSFMVVPEAYAAPQLWQTGQV